MQQVYFINFIKTYFAKINEVTLKTLDALR